MGGGEEDAIRPRFGMSMDEYTRCAHDGCQWRIWGHAILCTDHGGHSPAPEYRLDEWGKSAFRNGYVRPDVADSPIVSD